MKDPIGRNVYAYLMSYWEDLDDHLGRLEPNDLNLDYVGVSHLDCVSRVSLGGPLSHGSSVVVFFDRGHPRFWNFYSTIPVDVVRVKS